MSDTEELTAIDWHHDFDGPICPTCQTPINNIVGPDGRPVEGHIILCIFCTSWLIVENQKFRLTTEKERTPCDEDANAAMRSFEAQAHEFQQGNFH